MVWFYRSSVVTSGGKWRDYYGFDVAVVRLARSELGTGPHLTTARSLGKPQHSAAPCPLILSYKVFSFTKFRKTAKQSLSLSSYETPHCMYLYVHTDPRND